MQRLGNWSSVYIKVGHFRITLQSIDKHRVLEHAVHLPPFQGVGLNQDEIYLKSTYISSLIRQRIWKGNKLGSRYPCCRHLKLGGRKPTQPKGKSDSALATIKHWDNIPRGRVDFPSATASKLGSEGTLLFDKSHGCPVQVDRQHCCGASFWPSISPRLAKFHARQLEFFT